MVFFATGCQKSAQSADTLSLDTMSLDTTMQDTMEVLIAQTPMPKAADELFDDFMFNFAANRKTQFARILFPLKVCDNGNDETIGKKDWKMNHFFMEDGFYTLIADSRKQLKNVKDTTIKSVIIEHFDFQNDHYKQYCFQRIKGKWMLTSIVKNPMEKHKDASFLSFYHNFAGSLDYQMEHIGETIAFSGPDPDDEFSDMNGEITRDTWPAMALNDLPEDKFYNIEYGASHGASSTKILAMRGISNGMEMRMTFKKENGKWILTRLEQ